MYKERVNKHTPPLVKELLAETNGERIRSMSDEEMARKLYDIWHLRIDKEGDISTNWCDGSCSDSEACNPEKHKACILRWLRQPAKEGS